MVSRTFCSPIPVDSTTTTRRFRGFKPATNATAHPKHTRSDLISPHAPTGEEGGVRGEMAEIGKKRLGGHFPRPELIYRTATAAAPESNGDPRPQASRTRFGPIRGSWAVGQR